MKTSDDCRPIVFQELLQKYIAQLSTTAGFSPNTIRSYKDCFAVLFLFLEMNIHKTYDEVCFATLDVPVIISFLDWLEAERGCSITTRNQRLAILSSFAKYSAQMNFKAAGKYYSDVKKIHRKRGKGKARSYFSTEELQIILSEPKLHTLVGRRDSILLALMYFTGSRAQEMCDLKVRDFQYITDGHANITLHGKGGKTRTIPIPAQISEKLKDFIKYQGINHLKDSYVFNSQTNSHMSVSCVEEIFKKYVAKAKKDHTTLFLCDSYSPHSMRHTTAVHMLEAGISLPKIQRFLGHVSIASTQIYAEISQESLDRDLVEWNNKTWGHLGNFCSDDDLEKGTVKATPQRRPTFLR